jgi:hypothetical protein
MLVISASACTFLFVRILYSPAFFSRTIRKICTLNIHCEQRLFQCEPVSASVSGRGSWVDCSLSKEACFTGQHCNKSNGCEFSIPVAVGWPQKGWIER